MVDYLTDIPQYNAWVPGSVFYSLVMSLTKACTCTIEDWSRPIFSSPGRSPGRANVLPLASASALAAAVAAALAKSLT